MNLTRFVLTLAIAGLIAAGEALGQAGPFVSVSKTTSGTPGTPVKLVDAIPAGGKRKIILKVEGNAVVCFSQFTTAPTAGQAGTWCLKGGTTAGDGTGGSYVTPDQMSDPNEIWMVSATASVPVTAWIQ